MFVCSKTPPREVITGVHIWYGSKRNLSGKVLFVIKIPSDQPFGRYCPKTGHLSKKNSLYFEVFDIIKGVTYEVST